MTRLTQLLAFAGHDFGSVRIAVDVMRRSCLCVATPEDAPEINATLEGLEEISGARAVHVQLMGTNSYSADMVRALDFAKKSITQKVGGRI